MPKEYKTNEYFAALERSASYKAMEKVLAKALYDQWENVILSGIINTFFNKYKRYFVNRRGVKIKIAKKGFVQKADENDNGIDDDLEVTSTADLDQQAKDTLQNDKLLLDAKFFNMGALVVFLNGMIDKKMNSLKTYYKSPSRLKEYLKETFNKAGQNILESIKGYEGPTFKMTKQEYLQKLKYRVDKLFIDLDKTTKKSISSELIKGMQLKETKSQIIKRMQSVGLTKAKTRANQIINTETQAAFEYMRFETARLNGVTIKIWRTALDERVCPVCAALEGTTVGMEKDFESSSKSLSFSGLVPPAHGNCHCFLEYETVEDSYLKFIKAKKKDYVFYEMGDQEPLAIINPYAVWAGGNNLVGKDKNVGNLYNELKDLDKPKIKLAISSVLEDEDYRPTERIGELIQQAREELSDIGFVQLLLSLGFTRKIPSKN